MLPFDIRHIVVCHVQKKLFTIKNSPVFLAHPVYRLHNIGNRLKDRWTDGGPGRKHYASAESNVVEA